MNYVGSAPLTEPEAQALYNFTLSHNFRIMLTYHTQGKEIYWQFQNYAPKDSYSIGMQFAKARGEISDERFAQLVEEINTIPEKIEKILEDKERLQWFASKVVNIKDAFFIGRGIDYAVGMEGSLKLKEISYIHSEAYAAGELKHGPISLIEDGTVVFSVVTQSALYEKTISNMVEVKSRGAKLFGLTTYGNYAMEDVADFTVYTPRIDNLFAASLSVVPLQLLSYYVSVGKGYDVDKPRNLAKSVTVE